MTNTDREIALANTISRIAVNLDLALVEALDSRAVEWIAVSKNLRTRISFCVHSAEREG